MDGVFHSLMVKRVFEKGALMFFGIKGMIESLKYWKKHFSGDERTPWTAEFSMGYTLRHYPIFLLEIFIEDFVLFGIVVYFNEGHFWLF